MTLYDPIALGIQWDRLISITDEIVNTLVRTSFSTNVRESYDLSCVLFDARGRSVAQGTYSVPSFTGTAPATLKHMLAKFPPESLRPGDVIATNDPWLGTGHLFDINVMQPVFRKGRIVGYSMSITHLPDIGGAGFGASAREIYEEGLRLPILKIAREGVVDEHLFELIRCNVRVSDQTIGDLLANIACTTVGGRMLSEFIDEYDLEDIQDLSEAIISFSDNALREQLRALPEGCYRNSIQIEGYDESLTLSCAVHVRNGSALVDFDGTSPAVLAGINVPICYSRAMALYSIKCLTTPNIPNNEGSIGAIDVAAPPGCVLNAIPPSPTGGRHVIGHFIGPLIFGALAPIVPDRVQADSGMLNVINVQGTTRDGLGVSSIFFASGGYGALKGLDGAATTPSPSNMTGTPIEVWENLTGTFVGRKELLADSGGAGEFRGGLGQVIEIRNDNTSPMTFSCLSGRNIHPPLGVLGGHPGRAREVRINGEIVHPKGRYFLEPGDVLQTLEAGGGGYGDPKKRARERVIADIENGYVTEEAAATLYSGGT